MSRLHVGMLFDGATERYGILTVARHLVEGLGHADIEVTGIFLTHGDAQRILSPFCNDRVQLDVGPMPRTRIARGMKRDPRGMARLMAHVGGSTRHLVRIVREKKIDIIHSHYLHTYLIGGAAARAARVASVWHLHGGYLFRGMADRFWRGAARGLADRIVCISNWVQGTLPTAWRRRSVVIHNGLPAAEIRAGGRRGEFRREFGVPPDAPWVGTFGGIIARKGFEYFVDAAIVAGAAHPGAYFALVGGALDDDPDGVRIERKLRERVEQSQLAGRFIFAGHRPEAWRHMPDFDVIVLPTVPLPGDPTPDFGEGFGLVTLESMVQGVATIATDCGATRELIDDGESGLIVPPRDAARLASALDSLLRDPARRARLGQAAAERSQSRYDAGMMVRSVASLYDLLGNERDLVN